MLTIARDPSGIVPESWRALYGINPMAGVIEGFRWSLFGGTPPGSLLWVSSGIVLLILVTGLYAFRRMERTFVDVV